MPRRPDLAIHLGALSRMGLLDDLILISKKHHVLFDDILSTSRSKNIMLARIDCYLHLRKKGLSYPEIGKIMLRDHTTIIYVVRKHSQDEERGSEAPPSEPPATGSEDHRKSRAS